MTLRGLFFIGLFGLCSLLALSRPFAGIIAYVVHYHSFPERSWWGAALTAAGVRYSLTISIFLAIGTLLNLKRLPYGRLVSRQEALYLAYLGWMVFLRLIHGQQTTEDAVDKMLKMAVFLLALSHVVVTLWHYDRFMQLLSACAFYVGYEAYHAPAGYYYEGRLNGGVGGPDFIDSNALGAHALALLPFVGVQFLTADGKRKPFYLLAGALAANTIVLTRARSAYLAALTGLIAGLILVPKGQRKRLMPLVALAALGATMLVDAGFMQRMGTLQAGEREKDGSAQSRLETWKGSLPMIRDNVLGVGPGNYGANIGAYMPKYAGRDAHSTYIRCAAELGWLGFALFVALVTNAFATLSKVGRSVADHEGLARIGWHVFSLRLTLIMYLVCAIFGSFNQIEMFWWILLLPAALERVAQNALAAQATP